MIHKRRETALEVPEFNKTLKTYKMREIIIPVLILIGLIFLLLFTVGKGTESLRKAYLAPDTTITYKNGKYDTVITKKSLPAWLK